MSAPRKPDLVRLFLYAMIGSIAATALIAIGVLLFGEFEETELRILLTTVVIAGTAICGLSCAALRQSRGALALPLIGISLAVITAALIITVIWAEIEIGGIGRVMVTFIVWTVAVALLCLLLLARLERRFRWSLWGTCGAIAALTILLTVMVLHESDPDLWRVAGSLAVLVCAGTISVPMFHRLSAAPTAGQVRAHAAREEAVNVLCPMCGARQAHPLGEMTCTTCGCRFVVQLMLPASPAGGQPTA